MRADALLHGALPAGRLAGSGKVECRTHLRRPRPDIEGIQA